MKSEDVRGACQAVCQPDAARGGSSQVATTGDFGDGSAWRCGLGSWHFFLKHRVILAVREGERTGPMWQKENRG